MTIEQREIKFRDEVHRMIAFPFDMRKAFVDYWTEPNKSGSKMRWELEKTWDLTRRLQRWQRTSKEENKFTPAPVEKEPVSKEIAELDRLLIKYRQHPTEIPFTSLANYYPYMKQEKLLKPFSRQEVESIKSMFNCDQVKCRAYCVEQTLRGYTDNNLMFSDIMGTKLRTA